MTAIPKRLTTKYLLDADQAKAGNEACSNLHRLIQAGYFDAAHRIGVALVSPGPWRLSRKSPLLYSLSHALRWLCAQLQCDCPAVGDEPALSAPQVTEWLVAQNGLAAALPMALWAGEKPTTTWDAAGLEQLLQTIRPGAYGGEFNWFREHAMEELSCRIRTHPALRAGDSPSANAVSAELDERGRALGLNLSGRSDPPSPKFAALTHAQLAEFFLRGIKIAFPRDVASTGAQIVLPSAVLDLLDGQRDAAIAHLVRVLPGGDADADSSFRNWAPFGALLRSRALAPALGITDAGVEAYLDAFASRSPYTLKPPAKPVPWKMLLKQYVERAKDMGAKPEQLTMTVESGAPPSKPLLARARRGHLLNTACSEADIDAAQTRLGVTLPPSYREFLLASDGLIVPDFLALLPVAQIDRLHALDPDTVAAWTSGNDDDASDEDYNTYGLDQDCIHMRPRHLNDALQISTSCDGDVLLLVPGVRFGEEWEAWFLGAKNPGAFRFRSFRDMMEQRVLAEETE